jgi:hypothetical protein
VCTGEGARVRLKQGDCIDDFCPGDSGRLVVVGWNELGRSQSAAAYKSLPADNQKKTHSSELRIHFTIFTAVGKHFRQEWFYQPK